MEDLRLAARLNDFTVVFLSIVLQSLPFVLVGVFASAIVQQRLRGEVVARWMPRPPVLAAWPWREPVQLSCTCLARAGLLLGTGVLIAKLLASDQLHYYRSPSFDGLTALTGVALAAMGALELERALRPTRVSELSTSSLTPC